MRNFKLKVVNGVLKPSIKVSVPYKKPIIPQKPSNLNFSTSNNVSTITWDNQNNIVGFKVYYKDEYLCSVTDNFYVFNDEVYGTVSVKAYNDLAESDMSDKITIKTIPNAPTNFIVNNKRVNDSIEFSISFVDNSAIESSYRIEYTIDSKPTSIVNVASATGIGTLISKKVVVDADLDKIAFKVASVNEVGFNYNENNITLDQISSIKYGYDVYLNSAVLHIQNDNIKTNKYSILYSINDSEYTTTTYTFDNIESEMHRYLMPLSQTSNLKISLAKIKDEVIQIYSKEIFISKNTDLNCKKPNDIIYNWISRGEVELSWEDTYREELQFELVLNLNDVESVIHIDSTSTSEVGSVYKYRYRFEDYGVLRVKVRMLYPIAPSEYSNEEMIIYRNVSGLPPSYIKKDILDNGFRLSWEAQEYVESYELSIKRNGTEEIVNSSYDFYDIITNHNDSIEYEIKVRTYFHGGVVSNFTEPYIFKPIYNIQSIYEAVCVKTSSDNVLYNLITNKEIEVKENINSMNLNKASASKFIYSLTSSNLLTHEYSLSSYFWGSNLYNSHKINTVISNKDCKSSSNLVNLTFVVARGYENYVNTTINTTVNVSEKIHTEINKVRILTIGDSITAGHPNFWAETMTGNEKSQYQYWLNRRLKGSYEIINKGYGSDTTDKILDRFNKDVLGYNAKYCIIQGGTNDIYWSMAENNGDQNALDRKLQTMKSNITEMIKRCWDNDIIPIVGTLIPRTGATGIYKTALYDFNAWIIDFCTTNENIFYSDWFNAGKEAFPPTPLEDPKNPGALNPIYDGKQLLSLNLLNCWESLRAC